MNFDLSFRIKNQLSELSRLKEAVHKYCEFRELPSNIVYSIKLALDEVVMNVISYGYDDREEHVIDIFIRSGQGYIDLIVEDDGKPFNPLEFKTPDLKATIEERLVGGLGIHLVRSYMSEIEYEREGGKNRLRMRKHL